MNAPTWAELRDELAEVAANYPLADLGAEDRDHFKRAAGRILHHLDLTPEADGRGGWRLVTPWHGTEHVM